MNTIPDMPTLKEKFMHAFFLGDKLREQCTYWQNMKFDHNKYDAEQFTYDLKVLCQMIGMSDKQVLAHSKVAFPPKIEAQFLEKDDTDTAIGKTRVVISLLKSEPPQSTRLCMLPNMTDRNDNDVRTRQHSKTKPNTSHEAFARLESIKKG